MTSLPPIDRSALIATRRDLHQHPELGFEETRTATLVAEPCARAEGTDHSRRQHPMSAVDRQVMAALQAAIVPPQAQQEQSC